MSKSQLVTLAFSGNVNKVHFYVKLSSYSVPRSNSFCYNKIIIVLCLHHSIILKMQIDAFIKMFISVQCLQPRRYQVKEGNHFNSQDYFFAWTSMSVPYTIMEIYGITCFVPLCTVLINYLH